jgi:hypothetical protein
MTIDQKNAKKTDPKRHKNEQKTGKDESKRANFSPKFSFSLSTTHERRPRTKTNKFLKKGLFLLT